MKNVPGKILNVLLVLFVILAALLGIVLVTGWVQDLTYQIIAIAVIAVLAFFLIRAICAKPRVDAVSKSAPGAPAGHDSPEGHRPRRRGGVMATVRLFLVVVLVVALAYIAYVYKDSLPTQIAEEKVEITDQEIMEKLVSVSDLVTYSFQFDNTTEVKNSRQLFGFDVPFTTNTVTIKYSGVIKVGYDVSNIKPSVDNENMKIYVTLPEAKVTDKYLYEDKLEYSEKNNIFNPISSDKISECLEEILNTELQRAEEQGIYEKAEENAKSIITDLLSVYQGYSVIYK